jgi:hypothetical protein
VVIYERSVEKAQRSGLIGKRSPRTQPVTKGLHDEEINTLNNKKRQRVLLEKVV